MHIRRGRLARTDALKLIKMHDGRFPWLYLGTSISDVLKELGMTLDEFIQVCDRFANKKLFVCDARGNLVKDKDGNLTKINYDNMEDA
jgi:hypothetical protein